MVRTILIGFAVILTVGCTSVSHTPRAHQSIGSTLPVEVRVANADHQANGWVHFRTSQETDFQEIALQPRGDALWTMLPTASLQTDEWVEYYIDVDVDGELRGLGSPSAPYTTVFLDEIGMILAGLRMHVHASDTTKPVHVVVTSEYGSIGVPSVEYEMPGVPGVVSSTMTPKGAGRYEMVIPDRSVQPGTWRFVAYVPVGDVVFRFPEDGFSVVYVEEARVRSLATAGDNHGDRVSDVARDK